jgi:hypothetical protein
MPPAYTELLPRREKRKCARLPRPRSPRSPDGRPHRANHDRQCNLTSTLQQRTQRKCQLAVRRLIGRLCSCDPVANRITGSVLRVNTNANFMHADLHPPNTAATPHSVNRSERASMTSIDLSRWHSGFVLNHLRSEPGTVQLDHVEPQYVLVIKRTHERASTTCRYSARRTDVGKLEIVRHKMVNATMRMRRAHPALTSTFALPTRSIAASSSRWTYWVAHALTRVGRDFLLASCAGATL